jgi:cell wall-associated NlpC family hydrolase
MFLKSGISCRLALLLSIILLVFVSSCSKNNYGSRYSTSKNRSTKKKPHGSSGDSDTYVYKNHKKKDTRGETINRYSEKSTRKKIIDTAYSYIGANYRSGGKNPDTGFDCSGFTSFVFRKNGIDISGPSHDLAKLGKSKNKNELAPGDLVFFGSSERISHVAIVSSVNSNSLEVIHSTTSAGVKKDNILHSEYWESRFLFGRDIIETR